MELNYFQLSLMSFLKESHPEKLNNIDFIAERADAAAAEYEQAIRNGNNDVTAAELANIVLFSGLNFSKHDTIKNILWREFANEIPEEDATDLAIKLLPELEAIFNKYTISDGFAYEPEFEILYTELTGLIALMIKSRNF